MRSWYQIKAQKNKRAKILIFEQIGEDFWGDGVSAKKFIQELDALDVDDIDLHINSPGGSVFEGNSIYNALKAHKASVHVVIDGIAASIASVIAMAGDDVSMPQNAMMMIHDPSGLVVGTAGDMRKMAEALDRVKTGIVGAYKTRVDMEDEKISDLMTAETWMTAQEAKDMGFADEVIEPVKIQANFQFLANFKNAPAWLKKTSGEPDPASDKQKNFKPKEEPPMEITLELIQSKHPEIIEAIIKTATADQIKTHHPQFVEACRKEGATAETDRIQAVKSQLISGHEKLIEGLMFDGETTGEQAAVKVLQAEKQIRNQTIVDNTLEAPPRLPQVTATGDGLEANDSDLPVDQRCKKAWDKSASLQAEFGGNFDSYLAYEKAVASGKVRVLRKAAD